MLPHDAGLAARPAAFRQLHAELLQVHAPADAHERVLVEEFIEACWELQCARSVGRYFWDQVGGAYHNGLPGVAHAQFQEREARFRTHMRFRAEAERSYYRALDRIERMQRSRGNAPAKTMTAAASAAPPAPETGTQTESAVETGEPLAKPAHPNRRERRRAAALASKTAKVRAAGQSAAANGPANRTAPFPGDPPPE